VRIFYCTKSDEAKRIATYLISARLVFQISYTFPDVIQGPPRFIFRLMRHAVQSNPVELDLLTTFLNEQRISIHIQEQ
jgi:hypothetical protein